MEWSGVLPPVCVERGEGRGDLSSVSHSVRDTLGVQVRDVREVREVMEVAESVLVSVKCVRLLLLLSYHHAVFAVYLRSACDQQVPVIEIVIIKLCPAQQQTQQLLEVVATRNLSTFATHHSGVSSEGCHH